MLKVGLTGGIGSGKSTVSKIFSLLGISIYDSDSRAKYLMRNDLNVVEQLKLEFGSDIYVEKELNSALLGSLVFNDPIKLQSLNSIVHPAVAEDFESWLNQNSGGTYIIKEAAILFESGAYKSCDKIIGVVCDTEVRLKRTMERDNQSREAVLARMRNQLNQTELKDRVDYIIDNSPEKVLIPQVIALNELLLAEQ